MFERFSEPARRALFFARFEASELGSTGIETEHLLLGLIREATGVTSLLFANAGIVLDATRDEVIRRVPERPKVPTSVEIPFSPALTRVLRHTEEEANRLSHDHIGTEHLLLGLLREDGGIAADVLASRGLRIARVREQAAEPRGTGEPPERPGPPGVPANTFTWPWLRFKPSRTVHVLYSGLKPPQQPVVNFSGPGLQAYGHTLTEAIVHAWHGNRWHADVVDGLDDGTRYDFYIELAQHAPADVFEQMWRDAIEEQFGVAVTRETRPRPVWIATRIGPGGSMLRHYGEASPGFGVALGPFNLVMKRPHDAPLFPLKAFTVHSVPFFYLARWFEEFLDGQVIDETGSSGLYGFELTRTVASRDELIDLLRDEAGVGITGDTRDMATLVVRSR